MDEKEIIKIAGDTWALSTPKFYEIRKEKFPLRHMNFKGERKGEAWLAARDHFSERLKTRGNLLALIGGRGGGKTLMATDLAKDRAREGGSVRYITAMDFFLEIKASWSKKSSETEKQVIERFAHTSLLVLDEHQERSESEWEDRLLTNLLDRRYGNLKDTIIISNQEKQAFESSLGNSILSRLNETGGVKVCNWGSYR